MAQAEDSFCAPDAVTRQVDENFNDFAFAGADAMKSATEQRDTLTRWYSDYYRLYRSEYLSVNISIDLTRDGKDLLQVDVAATAELYALFQTLTERNAASYD